MAKKKATKKISEKVLDEMEVMEVVTDPIEEIKVEKPVSKKVKKTPSKYRRLNK